MPLLSAVLTLCLLSYVEGSGRFPAFLVGGWRERGIGAVVDDDDLTDISLFSMKKSSLWGEKIRYTYNNFFIPFSRRLNCYEIYHDFNSALEIVLRIEYNKLCI